VDEMALIQKIREKKIAIKDVIRSFDQKLEQSGLKRKTNS
jgi:hypothetical protein